MKDELIGQVAYKLFKAYSAGLTDDWNSAKEIITLITQENKKAAIDAINSDGVISNPRARKNAVEAITDALDAGVK